VTVTVNKVDNPVEANPDTAETTENSEGPTLIDVLANDEAPDGGKAVLSFDEISANGGTITDANDDGVLEYTPAADFAGTDTFQYTLEDTDGDTATATVTVDVAPQNEPPVARDDTFETGQFGEPTEGGNGDGPAAAGLPLQGNVFADNGTGPDTDPDPDDTLQVTQVNGDPANIGTQVEGSQGGLFTVDDDGDLIFDPNSDFNDLLAEDTRTTTIQYTVSDGAETDTAQVEVTVNGQRLVLDELDTSLPNIQYGTMGSEGEITESNQDLGVNWARVSNVHTADKEYIDAGGPPLDLIINITRAAGDGPVGNIGFAGAGAKNQINVTEESVFNYEYQFVEHGTDTPVALDELSVGVRDLDARVGGLAEEQVFAFDADQAEVVASDDGGLLAATVESDGIGLDPKQSSNTAPLNHATFEFTDTDGFTIQYDLRNGDEPYKAWQIGGWNLAGGAQVDFSGYETFIA
jgi:VCBS repeat-containing protein